MHRYYIYAGSYHFNTKHSSVHNRILDLINYQTKFMYINNFIMYKLSHIMTKKKIKTYSYWRAVLLTQEPFHVFQAKCRAKLRCQILKYWTLRKEMDGSMRWCLMTDSKWGTLLNNKIPYAYLVPVLWA